MQVAKVLISENRATVQDLKMITSGTVGATVAFEFDETWDGWTRSYLFRVGFKVVQDAPKTGVIPAELIKKPGVRLEAGVFGTKGGLQLPTIWADLGVVRTGVNPSGDPSTNPQLPVWAQLQQGVEAADQKAEELQKNLGKAVQIEPQDFTEEQQAQARENVGAASQSDMAKATERLLAAERDFPVVCSASSEVVTVHDASDHALKGLVLYGKTTQDGTPTPETPVDLVSVGDSGSVDVNVCGKNMFNYPEWRNLWIAKGTAVYENNGITITATGADCYTDYGGNFPAKARIPVSEGETVTLSWEETSNASGNVVIFPNGLDEGNVGVNNATAKSLTYTAGKGVAFVTFRFGVANAGTTISYKNIQVEHGDTATAFEPYKAAQSLAISTPNGLYEHDYIDCAKGVCVQGSAERVLDGTENYSLYTNPTFNNTQIRLHYDGGQKRNASAGSLCGAHCNYFAEVTPDQSYIGTYDGFCLDHKGTVISFNCKGFISNMTTVDEWVSFVKGRYAAGNPIIIRYPLATPIETPLSAEEIAAFKALHTNKPNTTVYTDGNAGIKLDYVADTKAYIDNKFAELAAAIVNNT